MSARETEMVPPEREEENKKREASQGIREEHVSSRLWSSKTSAVKISSKKRWRSTHGVSTEKILGYSGRGRIQITMS